MFNLYSNLLEKNTSALKKIGPDFVLSFIQAMDGEKDPRNLTICFRNVCKIVAHLPFDMFAEDLFEVTSCYFPIDFTPPPNDPFGVTREELVSGLRACIASTRKFAEYALPLLFEKLSSDILEAKVDSLLTLSECLQVYDVTDVKDHAEDIWSVIRRDFLLGGIRQIELPSLAVLHNLLRCLSTDDNTLDEFLNAMVRDCNHSLKDPDMPLAEHIGKILETILSSCQKAYDFVVSKIVPTLIKGLSDYANNSKRSVIVKIIHYFCIPAEDKNFKFNTHKLSQHRDDLVSLLRSLLTSTEDTSLKSECLQCLVSILTNCDIMTIEESKSVVDHVLYMLMSPAGNDVYEICLRSIQNIVQCCNEQIVISFIDTLKSKINEHVHHDKNAMNIDDNHPAKTIERFFRVLSVVGSMENYAIDVVKFLLDLYFDEELIKGYGLEVLKCLYDVVKSSLPRMNKEFDELVFVSLMSHTIKEVRTKKSDYLDDPCILIQISKICQLIIAHVDESRQAEIANMTINGFIHNDWKELNSSRVEDSLMNHCLVQDQQSNYHSEYLTPIAKAVCTPLYTSVFIPDKLGLLQWLKRSVQNSKDNCITESGCKCFASLLNKMSEGELVYFILLHN